MPERRDADRWRSLIRTSPNFITVVDRQHRVEFINHPVPGLDPAEIVGRSVYEFVDPAFLSCSATAA